MRLTPFLLFVSTTCFAVGVKQSELLPDRVHVYLSAAEVRAAKNFDQAPALGQEAATQMLQLTGCPASITGKIASLGIFATLGVKYGRDIHREAKATPPGQQLTLTYQVDLEGVRRIFRVSELGDLIMPGGEPTKILIEVANKLENASLKQAGVRVLESEKPGELFGVQLPQIRGEAGNVQIGRAIEQLLILRDNQLWTMSSDGSRIQSLLGNSTLQLGDARIRPDGMEVAFLGSTGTSGVGEVYILDLATRTPIQLTRSGNRIKLNTGLTWSRDGRYLFIVQGVPGNPNNTLVRVERSTGTIQPICPMGGSANLGDTDANGNVIFTGGNGCYAEVRVAQGSSCRKLLDTPLADNNVRLSPDGNWIAWSKQRPGTCGQGCAFDVAVIASSGDVSTIRTLSTSGCALQPKWSPDGNQLIYNAEGRNTITDLKSGTSRIVNVTGTITDWGKVSLH